MHVRMSVFPWFYALFYACLVLFITLIVISHRFICDCVYFFLLIVNLLLILGFMLIMCVYFQLSSFCLFYFVCRSFLLTYSIRLRLSLQLPLSSLNFFSLVTCFLVMNALFNCFVLCLLHLLLPIPPCYVFCLFVFSRRRIVIFPDICYYDCYS